MKRGFTLLELLIVIIILGVLATLGIVHYRGVVEKSRGAEAKQVIGLLRQRCAVIFMTTGSTQTCTNANLVGAGTGIPGPWNGQCELTHYFHYFLNQGPAADRVAIIARRCIAGQGKLPSGTVASADLRLETCYLEKDEWFTTAGY